jgi:hypothetical protein
MFLEIAKCWNILVTFRFAPLLCDCYIWKGKFKTNDPIWTDVFDEQLVLSENESKSVALTQFRSKIKSRKPLKIGWNILFRLETMTKGGQPVKDVPRSCEFN